MPRMEDKLREAALAVSSAEGERIYEDLMRALASILEVDFALISVYVEPARTRLRTLASFFDGRIAKNVEYPIAGTPCEHAIGRAFGFFPEGARGRFAADGLLQQKGIEGYAASTLNDASGRPIGLVSVMSRKRLENGALIEAMLKIFAARISSEIERRRTAEASEGQYRAIFDAAADTLVLRDAQFRIVDVNPAYLAMTGKRREDVIGLQELTLTRGHDPVVRARLHAEALRGRPVYFVHDGRRTDGGPLVLEVRGVPMSYRGEPHVLYVGRDMTEAKLAERELRASWEQYRAIFDATADSLVLRDAEFRIVDVNAAYEAMSGRRREEAIGRHDVTMSDPALTAHIKALHLRALAGEQVTWEATARRKGGETFAIEVRGVPMLHQGRPHVLYIGRDITGRRQAEARLRASEEQYRAIVNAMDEPLVLRDAEFRIVDVNPAFEAMSGYTRDEVIGRTRMTLSDEPGLLAERRLLHERALAGEQLQIEANARRKDGTPIVIELRLVPIQYRGKPHVLQIGTEVTARRKSEAERIQLEAQLRQAQKMEAIGQLTGGIAHDFNNILQGILGNLSLAGGRQRKPLGAARHRADRPDADVQPRPARRAPLGRASGAGARRLQAAAADAAGDDRPAPEPRRRGAGAAP
jgi:PAS domain S-box-containing protein